MLNVNTARTMMLLVAIAAAASVPAAHPQLPPSILTPKNTAIAKDMLSSIADWIMTLDVGSDVVKNYNHTSNALNASIFVNGNLARVLLGSHRLTGNATHLAEALRWCDALVAEQVRGATAVKPDMEGGWWGVGYPTSVPLADGNIYLGDTGTAVTTLAMCARTTSDARQAKRFTDALTRYDAFVRFGCQQAGCGASSRGSAAATDGFINASAGAIGCGYYQGHLSTCPYVVATGTTGAAFEAELASLTKASLPAVSEAAEETVADSVRYMATLISRDNGSIPYVIDCKQPTWDNWPYDTLTYVTEGLLGAFIHVPKLRAAIATSFSPTVDFLLRSQNADGSWAAWGSPDQRRSPRVSSLIALFVAASLDAKRAPDPRLLASLERYVTFLSEKGVGPSYGVEDILNTSGFVGLALIELLGFGATWSPPAASA